MSKTTVQLTATEQATFADNPGLLKYAQTITDEFNKWAKANDEAVAELDALDMSTTAFMCNAINMAVCKSSHPEVREYFHSHAGH